MYKITIEKVLPKDERGYTREEKIYEQTVDSLDIASIVLVVNEQPKPPFNPTPANY